MITLAIAAAILAGMNVFILLELRNAPEGYQDETGFHISWRNDSDDAQDVSCVWLPDSVENALISRAAA